MCKFNSIEDVSDEIKNMISKNESKKNILLLYAFNATGKTRLSTLFNELYEDKVLCFNAFTEDLFKWDNENYVFNVEPKSWIVKLILDQGLDNEITNNFKDLTNSKIEPNFNLDNGTITFDIATGDESKVDGIKISKGEESIFIWSIFYTILKDAIDNKNTKLEDRPAKEYNELEYVIIDDPISSIDDSNIIKMAVKLVNLIKSYENIIVPKLKFIITTHHPMFYNVLYNSFKYNKVSYILSKNENEFELKKQTDSPFGYHLIVKKEIENAISINDIKKYHFNLFRSLLEKTANFLGYDNWDDCIISDKKDEFARTINVYSHGKLSELEYKELSEQDKNLFISVFESFIKEFKWNGIDENT